MRLKYIDGLMGFVVGDAMGVPLEFKSRKELFDNPVTKMTGFGTHNQPEGTWSDDTSMLIATMDAIIDAKNIDYKKIMDNSYYVPVTKYVNYSEDKIKIILSDLSSNYIYQPNLISVVSEELELIDYQLSNEEMILNFNNSIFFNGSEIKEEVTYPVISTIFSNYDVESVILKVNGEEILKKTLKNG